MTKRQEDTLLMFDVVIQFHTDNLTEMNASAPGFAGTISNFTSAVTEIKQMDAVIKMSNTGFAMNKEDYKKQACIYAVKVGKALVIYAMESSPPNLVLKGRVNYTKSQLVSMRDEELPQVLQNIHDYAAPLVTQIPNPLFDSGITSAKLIGFQDLINQYTTSIAMPRHDIVNRKTNIQKLDLLFDKANSILKNQLDNLAVQLSDELIIGWKNARIIVDSATNHTGVDGKVTDETTGEPLVGVEVKATVAKTGKVYINQSDTDGNYKLDVPGIGAQTIFFTLGDRKGQETVTLKKGKRTTLDFILGSPQP